jgi:shikimate kinase
MDTLVYQKTHTQNMHEVFALGGEILLREMEIAIAKEYALQTNCIISTGGGIVLNKIALDYFKEAGGKVIFLNTPLERIAQQLQGDTSRPLFNDSQKLYDFRLPLYSNYADVTIDVHTLSPEELALQIKEITHGF